MNQQKCLYCNEEFVGRRSDAKFCSDTCKAKYWEEKRNKDGEVSISEPPKKLSDNLRGVIGPGTQPAPETQKLPVLAPRQRIVYKETFVFISYRTRLEETQTFIRRLHQERDALLRNIEEIKRSWGLRSIVYGSGLIGGLALGQHLSKDESTAETPVKKTSKKPGKRNRKPHQTSYNLSPSKPQPKTGKMILGALMGLGAGAIADSVFKVGDIDRKGKEEAIYELEIKIKEIDVSLTSYKEQLRIIEVKLESIPQYETMIEEVPEEGPAFNLPAGRSLIPPTLQEMMHSFSALCGKSFPKQNYLLPNPDHAPQINTQKEIEQPIVPVPLPVLPIASHSDKIISSEQLQGMDYKALNFQAKWNTLFGYPSATFHCVLTGMSGEGKSTFAIQFANYLAQNFGSVIYVSGEEGFSKTFKDKIINNKAISPGLFVADLHSYEEIITEIPADIYNFIFIDSLDNMRIDAEKMKLLRERYKESALITISQSTKDGKMRGSYEIVHDCDIAVKVEAGIAVTTKNRFKEKGVEFKVFDN